MGSATSSEREAEEYYSANNKTTCKESGVLPGEKCKQCVDPNNFKPDLNNPNACVCKKIGYVPNFMAGAKPTDKLKCVNPCPTSIAGSDIGNKKIYTVDKEGKCVRDKDSKKPIPNDPYVEELVHQPGIFTYPKCNSPYFFSTTERRCLDPRNPNDSCDGASTNKTMAAKCCQHQQSISGRGTKENPYKCPQEYRSPKWSEYYHWQ